MTIRRAEGQRAPTIRPRDGAQRAPSPSHPRGPVIPAKAGTYWRRLAYAKAGTYPNAARPDRSTLSRRVRGVLSPYRERGIRALARLRTRRNAPRLQVIPGAPSFPRKREPTARASPTRKREPIPLRPERGYEIPAYAGMTARGAAAQEKASPQPALCYHSPVAAAPAKENNATQIP